jgi:hypothetical protein
MKTPDLSRFNSRKLLMRCIGLSLIAHAAALTYFYYHPLILHSPFRSLFAMNQAEPTPLAAEEEIADLMAKNALLEEVFEQIVVLSPHMQQPFDLSLLPQGIALAPNSEEATLALDAMEHPAPSIETSKEFASGEIAYAPEQQEGDLPALFVPAPSRAPIASQLQIDGVRPTVEIPSFLSAPVGEGAYDDLVVINPVQIDASYETEYSLNLAPQLASPDSLKVGDDLKIKTDLNSVAAGVSTDGLNLDAIAERSTLFIPKAPAAPTGKKEMGLISSDSHLEQYGFPSIITAAEWNDDFDVDVTFLPNPEGQGYIFSLSLKSNYDLSDHSLKQNLYFLLDRSSSVQKHRFAVYKRAVLKALSSMQPGDSFNILVMDKKIARFSPQSRPVTLKNIHAAEEFLDKQEGGGLFAASDIYLNVPKVLSLVPEDDEMHTFILLTDGKTSMNAERKQKAIKQWVEKNHGKVCLYTAAVGRDNDLVTLDMLSSLSGGKLLYSDTHASFPRKLSKLILDLKDPIAKDIIVSALPHNPDSHIAFTEPNARPSSLYSHQPYVIVGQIDEPSSFDIVIQGRHRDQWIAIKKSISFVDGQKGDRALEKQWNSQHANAYYSKFLEEGKAAHLKSAKEILKKYRAEVAAQ